MEIRILTGETEEMADLQQVFVDCADYTEKVTGLPPGPADAQSQFSQLPPDKDYDDKLVYGIYEQDRMVGCIDLIRGYPDDTTAYLGLLLLTPPSRGRGIGAQAYALVESIVFGWGTCQKILLAVVRTVEEVIPFWRRMGFHETGEVRPYQYESLESEAILMEKSL